MTPNNHRFTPKKVVIIGGGLAGLTTAYRLQQSGMEVEVYEAKSRVGGRVLTALINDNIIELGAQNISDGGEAKNILELIHLFKLEVIEKKVPFNFNFFLNGKLTSKNELLEKRGFTPEWLGEILPKIAAESNNMREVLLHLFDEQDPLFQIMSVRLAGFEGAHVEHLSPTFASTLYRLLLGQQAASIDPSDQYKLITTIKDGNSRLPLKLAEALHGKIHFQMPVTAIAKTPTHSYELTFKNGTKKTVDILVLAIPSSVYEDISFGKEVIPKQTLTLIQNIQYGSNSKIVAPFSGNIQFINDRMFAFSHDNTLTYYYTGKASYFNQKTIHEIYETDRKQIEQAFGLPPISHEVPQMAKDEHFIKYTTPIAYSWSSDPYAKGSYSTVGPGQELLYNSIQEALGEKVKALFVPIDNRLFFAGEHTSTLLSIPGTMEAACESGERTARMINNLKISSESSQSRAIS